MLHTFRWFSIPFLKTQKPAGPSNREQLVSRRTQLTPWLDRKLAIASIPCIRIECYPARTLELTQHLDNYVKIIQNVLNSQQTEKNKNESCTQS